MKRFIFHMMRYCLPILFVTYMVSITAFAHAHVVNGVTIVHSHPFQKGTDHSHTTVELLTIHSLSEYWTNGSPAVFISLSFIPLFLCLVLGRPQLAHRLASAYEQISLRAPPVVR